MKKATTGFILLAGLLVVAPMGDALDVTVTPAAPVVEEQITASFPAPEGAVNATVFICPGDSCRAPVAMNRESGVFRHTFYINETVDVNLKIKIEYQNGTVAWDNTTTFQMEAAGGNGIPGFTAGIVVAAVAAVAVLHRRTKS